MAQRIVGSGEDEGITFEWNPIAKHWIDANGFPLMAISGLLFDSPEAEILYEAWDKDRLLLPTGHGGYYNVSHLKPEVIKERKLLAFKKKDDFKLMKNRLNSMLSEVNKFKIKR